MMKASEITPSRQSREFVLVFQTGEEVTDGLKQFAREHDICGAHFTAIGAFSEVKLGYYELDKKKYKEIPLHEQVEVVALIGNISRQGEEVRVHAHALVSRTDGGTRAGHLISARVRPTLELFLSDTGKKLQRRQDEQSGLWLLDI